jgi:hypothetical protein
VYERRKYKAEEVVEAAWSITAGKLTDVLDKIIDQRGKPA